mmetsp:Transcript_11775/g.32670  ORF Transcript_11775/g.32670 Transcript_11775/m.32670 type:complete len:230 (-) Transcript_11775:1469-2158(-)
MPPISSSLCQACAVHRRHCLLLNGAALVTKPSARSRENPLGKVFSKSARRTLFPDRHEMAETTHTLLSHGCVRVTCAVKHAPGYCCNRFTRELLVTRTQEQLRKGSSSGHSMSQERPREEGVDELEKCFAFGRVVSAIKRCKFTDHLIELSAVCAAQAAALHRHGHRLVLRGVKEIHKRSGRLLRTETLSRRANAEQKGPEELRKTSVDDHADAGVADSEELSKGHRRC